MTAGYSEEQIREIRERCDIVELVGARVQLKRSGANHMGLCPFHQEKTPSFSVNSAKQIYHCFGCGAGGDAYSFLMEMEGLSFPEAVRTLAERVGVVLEEAEQESPEARQRRQERERLFAINEEACAFYHQLLLSRPEGAPGRRYLRRRGFDGETARRFRLGFAPAAWDTLAAHLTGKGFSPEQIRQTGLIRPRKEGSGDYDLFRNRLLFPIQDLQGRVVAFGGRVLDDSLPKYINSPESPVYRKGEVLYGLYQGREAMRRQGEGILVEGYFDVLALHGAGFEQVAAPCGTALTEGQAKLLKRYCDRVLTLFDLDSAGEKATFRAMEVFLQSELPAAMIRLEAGQDPDSFLREQSAEAFAERVKEARPLVECFMSVQLGRAGEQIEARARAAETVMAVLHQVRSEIERTLYVKALAEETGIDVAVLERMRPAPGRSAKEPSAPLPDEAPPPPEEYPLAPQDVGTARFEAPRFTQAPARREVRKGPSGSDKAQEMVLLMMVRSASVRKRVQETGPEKLFTDAHCRALAEVVLELPRTQERIDTATLLDRLDESGKERISAVLRRENELDEEVFDISFEDCLRSVERETLRRQMAQVMTQQEEAARSGDSEALSRCLRELTRIKKELQQR